MYFRCVDCNEMQGVLEFLLVFFGISACLMDLYEFDEKCLHQMEVICTQKAPGAADPQSCAEQIEIQASFAKLNGCTEDKNATKC